MRLLILGGTVFLGRHLTAAAMARGHEVTHFNRGQSDRGQSDRGQSHRGSPEGVEWLKGDRAGHLEALRGRNWDAVIDTCGFTPSVVRRSAEVLANAVGHYTFISSISAYASHPPSGIDEAAPTGTLTEEQLKEAEAMDQEERSSSKSFPAFYGPLKALCEQAAEAAMPGRVLTVRPGLIVGPHDSSDRFTYWVHRVARGGEVLAPGSPDQRLRVVDGRDLAEWIVCQVETAVTGVYNTTGPAEGTTMRELLETCRRVSGSDASFIWIDEEFLTKNEVGAWIELPLWIHSEYSSGFFKVRNDRAIARGLIFRDLEKTVADTLAWDRARDHDQEWKAGLDAEREKDLLRRFKGH